MNGGPYVWKKEFCDSRGMARKRLIGEGAEGRGPNRLRDRKGKGIQVTIPLHLANFKKKPPTGGRKKDFSRRKAQGT